MEVWVFRSSLSGWAVGCKPEAHSGLPRTIAWFSVGGGGIRRCWYRLPFPYYFTFIALSRLLLYLGLQLSSCMRTSESLGQKTAHSQPFLWFSGSTFSSPSPKTPMEILEETFIESCILLFNRKTATRIFCSPFILEGLPCYFYRLRKLPRSRIPSQ